MQSNETESPQNLYTLRRPDWNAWRSATSIKLWHAAALACDLDPYQFTTFGPNLDRVFSQPPAQFTQLLSLAMNALSGGSILKSKQINVESIEETEVVPANFGAWATSIHYPLPAAFPWQDAPVLPLSREWPWGTYETGLLRHLAAAANRFWRHYDPSDATTAPTNEDVVGWLVAQGVSKRNAEVMATMLRADGLRAGPRT